MTQRGANADGALEVAVVVLRDVQANRGDPLERRIVHHRGGGQSPFVYRQTVQERFQRRTCLAQCQYAVDVRRIGQLAAAADIGQHLAAVVVDDDGGAVLDICPLSASRCSRTDSVAARCRFVSSVLLTRFPVGAAIVAPGGARYCHARCAGYLRLVHDERDRAVLHPGRIVLVPRHPEQGTSAVGGLLRSCRRPFQQGREQQRLRPIQCRGWTANNANEAAWMPTISPRNEARLK